MQGSTFTAKELKAMNFDVLNFTGEWVDFLGKPEHNFNAVIFSSPGEGKSTFAIQFAAYLANFFGKTVYNTNEEGKSLTLKEKLKFVQYPLDKLIFSDWKNFEQLRKELRKTHYNFVFIDSLDNGGITAEKMKILRNEFPKTAFITISQVTKEGKMRGSNELAHDADIVITVENGIAKTTKNRFKMKGTEFSVFE